MSFSNNSSSSHEYEELENIVHNNRNERRVPKIANYME